MIQAFSKKLMDNIANDAKVSREIVEGAFHEWRSFMEEQQYSQSLLHDNFILKIDGPRNERHVLYDDYCAEKSRLWNEWKHAVPGQKTFALHNYIRHPLPEQLMDGVEQERIYTKNIQIQ
jgi:hypothetical protein